MSIMKKLTTLTGLLLLAGQVHAASVSDNPNPAQDIAKPTMCAGEDGVWDSVKDNDVTIRSGSNLTVMFHGNRFPASRELVAAFEKANPKIKVTFASLPPASVLHKLIGVELNKNQAQKDLYEKIKGIDYPDVVMVPESNLKISSLPNETITDLTKIMSPIARSLESPKLYSTIKGVVAVMRADEKRIENLDDLKTTDAKFVLAGQQSQKLHAIFRVPSKFFGEALFEKIKKKDSTGYSQMIHHRSVPARIYQKCEDVGFQFAQSQPYLEDRFPGKFKFLELPKASQAVFDGENSYVSVTKKTTHKENAEKFVDFIMGEEGQKILERYKIGLK